MTKTNCQTWTIDPRRLSSAGVITFIFPALMKPTADSATLFRVQQADGDPVLTVDSTNQRVGVATASPGTASGTSGGVMLDVNGKVEITSASGYFNMCAGSTRLLEIFDTSVLARTGNSTTIDLCNASYWQQVGIWTNGSERVRAGNGGLTLPTVGNGILIKEGSNATMGTATLVLGAATVSTTKVTASSRIFLTAEVLGTVALPKSLAVTARTAGTSFTITSSDATDTSTVAWLIVEPA